MEQLLLMAPIAVPVFFWAIYHYHKDRHLPEPVGLLALTFLLGILAVYLSSLMYAGLDLAGLRFDAGYLAETNSLALLAYSMLAIGPIEELAKMLPFLVVVLRFRDFDEPMDGIIYASFIGLGYAALENWQYRDYLTMTEALARGFASPVIHMLFASIWGHWIAQAHLAGRSLLLPTLVSFVVAALLHGIYDFLVILNPRYALPVAALGILYIWWWRLRVLRALHRDASQERRL
ncbi:MAG: PrsW family intramembrane metalloprotease [Woeseiaceae bacterium]|jgi:RsiW-degrading membrane proteinase PrsW (M82 family)